MTVQQLVVYAAIGLLCGVLGQMLAGRSLGGVLASIVVGALGALVGGWIAGALGAPQPLVVPVAGGRVPILWAVLGAALITLVFTKLR